MKKQTIEIIIILLAGLLLLVMVTRQGKQPSAPAEVSFDEAKLAVSSKLAPAEQKEKIEYTSSSYRDPMKVPGSILGDSSRAPQERAAISHNLILKGISLAEDKPKAIINDKVLGVGDEIDGVKVLDITKEGVKVQMGTEEIILKIE